MTRVNLRAPKLGVTPVSRLNWSRFRPATRVGRMVEDLRTGGKDPVFRRNMIISFVVHATIILLPTILAFFGPRVEAYKLPKGSGVADPAGMSTGAQQEVVKVKAVKKKTSRRKLLTRSNSAIIFYRPDLDDSQALKDVQESTELTYKTEGTSAQDLVRMAKAGTGAPGETGGGIVKGGTGKSRGRLGAGGGLEGGWPEGSENSKIRFIRLDHGGAGWDDNMNTTDRSDLNFLEEFGKYSGFKVETQKFEGYKIGQIAAMDKGFKPPFLYMTGTSSIPLGQNDLKNVRDYINEGGMIFGDCGSPDFNTHFRAFANSLFPGSSLIEIADDDPIFRVPFILPNGAPPLWHHGGYKCMGVKYKNRWIVFYHPGDLKDAYRTGGSGLDSSIRKSAYELGTNVIYYAFTKYLDNTKQYRK